MINIIISVKGMQKISDRLYKDMHGLTKLLLQVKQQVPDKWKGASKLLKLD